MQSRPGENEVICQCMDCGNFVHRECLSQCHAHRKCRGHDEDLMPRCPQTKAIEGSNAPSVSVAVPPTPELFPSSPVIKRVTITGKRKLASSTVTIASLIDELSEDRLGGDRNGETQSSSASSSKSTKATTVMKRVAPFLAAGGVIGALALAPGVGVIAGLNMLVAGVSVEGMVAGLGFTAATAAATASRQIKKKNERKRLQEEMKSGAWAMQICWKVKQEFKDTPVSDEVFRKDAELLRRFQLPRRTAREIDQRQPDQHFAPSTDEIYALLFGILSTSSEFLSQVNAELARAFMERYTARLKRATPTSASSGGSNELKEHIKISKETLQDARMYVAHLVGATMQSFPSLSSTDAAIVSCSHALERVIFDDIYKPVMGALDDLFADENTSFYNSLDDIRRQPDAQHQLNMMLQHLGSSKASDSTASTTPAFDSDLSDAESKLVEMIEFAKSPLHKLELLCNAFRSICCFADRLHKTASNADILIPIVCALLVASPQISGHKPGARNFVSQIAFTSYFTEGGGKGVEGYVLTTFQAVLQVIGAVDLTQGHAQELAFFAHESSAESSEDEKLPETTSTLVDDKDQDEFFDAQS
jgi:hypothetical protein